MVENEVAYSLKSTGMTYPNGSDVLEARTIMLYAPTVRSMKHIGPLKQAFMRSMLAQSNRLTESEKATLQANRDSQDAETELELTGDLLLTSLIASPDVDYAEFLENFTKLLKQPELARIDGEANITDAFLNKLPLTELENLAGEYIANFIASSVLTG